MHFGKRLTAMTAVAGLVVLFCPALMRDVGAQETPHGYTLHLRECPAAYSGDDLFGTCHGTGVPGVDLSWYPDGPAVSGHGTTDENGNITFTYDTAILGVTMDVVPFDLITTYAYCSDTVTGKAFESHSGIGGNGLPIMSVGPGSYLSTDVTCDWYLIPPASDVVPTATTAPSNPDPTSSAGAVTGLPNTGAGQPPSGPVSPWPFAAIALSLLAFAFALRRYRTKRDQLDLR